MQRYDSKDKAHVGDFIAFDNRGKFYHGMPFEIIVGEVISIGAGDIINVKFDVLGTDVELELPFYLAQ